MKKNTYAIFIVTLFILIQPVQAALISNTDITASTDLVHRTDYPGSDWSVDKLADGITVDLPSPFAGFVSASQAGTVRLDFNSSYDLTNFILFNDVNVGAQGIHNFRLDFFNSADTFLGDFSGEAFGGIHSAQEYTISAFDVSRVDLVIIDSHLQIEVREVQFNGTLTNSGSQNTSVPEPSTLAIFALGLIGLASRRFKK
jgi:hypothetical protein